MKGGSSGSAKNVDKYQDLSIDDEVDEPRAHLKMSSKMPDVVPFR